MFGAAALADLQARTDYEAWLLEDIYEIADVRLLIQDHDQVVFPPNGAAPNQTIVGVGDVNLGNWRPGFLQAGAPLVFVTAFKLLDMLLEWVLVENGIRSSFRFAEKIGALKGTIVFPLVLDSRPWLRERLIALYEHLVPLRGTVIHNRHFKSSNGTLTVSSTKRTVGSSISISSADLRNLAFLLVSTLGFVQGTWPLDAFAEKRARHAFDELAHLHQMPVLGQLPPAFLNVRIYQQATDPIDVDLLQLRAAVAALRPNADLVWDLRIVAIDPVGPTATAYLVPWDELQGARYQASVAAAAKHVASVPADVDVLAAAQAMKLIP